MQFVGKLHKAGKSGILHFLQRIKLANNIVYCWKQICTTFCSCSGKKRQRKLSLDDVADCADEEDNDVVQGVFSLVPPLKVLSTKKLI